MNNNNNENAPRRTGDTIAIDGAYQYRALTEGNPVQRFWHEAKQLVIDRFLPPEPGDFVMDVGCGSGVIANHLAEQGAEVIAVDGNGRVAFKKAVLLGKSVCKRLVDELFEQDGRWTNYCWKLLNISIMNSR